jgi:hypothetical protein
MEKVEITWGVLGIIGAFCGMIVGMVRWFALDIKHSTNKLIDTVNGHTTVIAVESKRNDDQDDRLDSHDDDIDALKEKIYEVRYKRA